MQVTFFLAGEITQVKESIPWVCCASGNVLNILCKSRQRRRWIDSVIFNMSTIGHNEPEPNHFKILAAWHRKELKILLWNWCGAWRQAIDKMPLLIPTRAYFCWNIAFSYWSIRLSTACVHHVMVLFELLKACSLHYTEWWSFFRVLFCLSPLSYVDQVNHNH